MPPVFRPPGGARNKFKGELSKIDSTARRVPRPKMRFGMTLNKTKSYFLDRKEWREILTPAERQAMMTAGSYVRQSARMSIRRRKYHSAPDRPPTNWTGLLKRMIFFSYDPISHSVVVGPAYIHGPHRHVNTSKPTIPATLEKGGTVREKRPGRWDLARDPRVRGMVLPAGRVVRIAPRPYMLPALQKNEAKILEAFRDMINKSPLSMAYARRYRRAA